MDKDTWSIAISLVGLLLGLLSAHAQLKAVGRWALKATGERARAWMNRVQDDAELYANSASALVAYLVREAFALAFVLALSVAALLVLRGDTFTAPVWVRQGMLLLLMLWVGNKLADVSNMVDLTLRKARQTRREGV
ncbi:MULTISPECIES: hypothetical protein [unclassified Luteimonas]